MQIGHDRLKIANGILRTKMQWGLDGEPKPENFKDLSIFMSMFNDIEWRKNDENCFSNAEKVKNYSNRFLEGHGTFLGPGSEQKWYGC